MRRIWFALLAALVIQVPFLILMMFVGIHSALGGVWFVFYLPTIWLLEILRVPNFSPFLDTLIIALLQEIILLVLILPLMILWVRVKSTRKKAA